MFSTTSATATLLLTFNNVHTFEMFSGSTDHRTRYASNVFVSLVTLSPM